ncbi:MAG: hypothetical protein ACRDRS_09045 [Pseudonocardiaceae bacterium]
MSVDQAYPSSVRLTQSLLWNRTLRGATRPQPVVVLLGPVGSGKTTALKSISGACGANVIHALVDFDHHEPGRPAPTTVETLAQVAFSLCRTWQRHPAAVRFTRFTLGLIATQTLLEGQSRDQAKDTLRVSIEDVTHNRRADRNVAKLVDMLVDSAKDAGVVPALPAEIIKNVLPALIRTVTRQPTRKAKQWHAFFPEAEGATPLDALVSLNSAGSTKQTNWLAGAFFADIRESHSRMARLDYLHQCSCPIPRKARHLHNWVLLLDNIDHENGAKFVADLLAAREHHLTMNSSQHDALLIIAASGRWDSSWEAEWRAPWRSSSDNTGPARAVPTCGRANYSHWAGRATEAPQAAYYPVLLEPLSIEETAHILGVRQNEPEYYLAQRATGGLPGAVLLLKKLLRDQKALSRNHEFQHGPVTFSTRSTRLTLVPIRGLSAWTTCALLSISRVSKSTSSSLRPRSPPRPGCCPTTRRA